MAVLTGRSGQLYVDGARAARVTGWSLDEQRPMLDGTPLDTWDRVVVPGRRSGTGSAKLLYDPDDAAAGVFFDSIRLDTKGELGITLMLDSLTGESYPVSVHVSGASHAVARGEAQMRDISFKLSDTSIELEIIGSARASLAATGLYTGAVYGLSGAWTFLWTSSGPTIADPTDQSTNITFDTLGTFTITLTATLGTTVLIDTHVVEVIDVPLMWVSRATYAMQSTGGGWGGATAMDSAAQRVYHTVRTFPDVSVAPGAITVSELDYAGARIRTARLLGAADSVIPTRVIKMNDGGVFVGFPNDLRCLKLSADLSSILWQVRITNGSLGGTTYDPATDRIFFCQGSSDGNSREWSVGYIQGSSGAITWYLVDLVPNGSSLPSKPLVLANGRILFAYGAGSATTVLMECNNDFRVGGIPAPIRTVQHAYTSVSSYKILLETDNYIASVSGNTGANTEIELFNKADYSWVLTRRFNSLGVLLDAFYSAGQFSVVTQNAGTGWVVHRIPEDLSSELSRTSISSTLIPSGAAPGITTGLWGSSTIAAGHAAYDPALGLFAMHVQQRNLALTNAEMCVLFRSGYGADDVLPYGVAQMAIDSQAPSYTTSVLTPTGTFDRTYTFSAITPTTGASSITVESDVNSYQSYVLS